MAQIKTLGMLNVPIQAKAITATTKLNLNDEAKMLVDRSLFYLVGHFDRPNFYHFSKKHKPQQTTANHINHIKQKNTRDGNV